MNACCELCGSPGPLRRIVVEIDGRKRTVTVCPLHRPGDPVRPPAEQTKPGTERWPQAEKLFW